MMNTSALILMGTVQISVILATAYFFYRVLTAKKKPEPDSFNENDEG